MIEKRSSHSTSTDINIKQLLSQFEKGEVDFSQIEYLFCAKKLSEQDFSLFISKLNYTDKYEHNLTKTIQKTLEYQFQQKSNS